MIRMKSADVIMASSGCVIVVNMNKSTEDGPVNPVIEYQEKYSWDLFERD